MILITCRKCKKEVKLPRGAAGLYCPECDYKIREEIDEIGRPKRKVQRARKAKAK